MFFKTKELLKVSVGLVILLFIPSALCAEPKSNESAQLLKLVPNKCVALRKGRKCFANIKVEWSAAKKGSYCLRRSSDKLQINCWHGALLGRFKYIFASNEDEQLELVSVDSQQTIAVSTIKVSWVHNSKKRRTRWRVF